MAYSESDDVAHASPGSDHPGPAGWPHSRPLSPAQLPIWYAEMLRRDTPRWTQFSVTTLDGAVDRARLERALAAAVASYPALRTCLVRRQHGIRQLLHDASGFEVGWRDLSGLPPDTRERTLADILGAGERARFELHGQWLFRAEVVACAADRFLLLLFIHHIAADGMSLPLILRRVAEAYRGEADETEVGQYERWLDWQSGPEIAAAVGPAREFYRQALAGGTLWHERLYGRADSAAVPRDPPDLPQSTRVLEEEAVRRLSQLAERTGSTLFIVCLAAYGVALGRMLGTRDVVVAVFVSGRGRDTGLVAMAVNTLLVRLRLDGAAPEAMVRAAKEAWRPVRRLATVPVHALRQPGGGGPVPDGVQFAINFLDMRTMTFDLPGVAARTTYPQSAFPLNDVLLLLFREQDGSLRLRLFNGSGTPRLGVGWLAMMVEAMADVLHQWSGERPAALPLP